MSDSEASLTHYTNAIYIIESEQNGNGLSHC